MNAPPSDLPAGKTAPSGPAPSATAAGDTRAAWRKTLERLALELFAAGGELLREAWAILRRRPWLVPLHLAFLVGLWFLVHPFDLALADAVEQSREASDRWRPLAENVRKFGAFTDICVWTALVLALAWRFRRARWRRAAVACFLAACLAGATANLARPTAGRARPNAAPVAVAGATAGQAGESPGAFIGFSLLHYDHQSFPSGHTSTSAGGAVALLIVYPPLGLLAVPESLAVGAACMYCKAHWFADVTVGWGLGLGFGALLGTAHWRLERRRAAELPGGGAGRAAD
jgi:membrane-associated phospholipid phosphatase